jgi:Tol biopolymer transport system component
VTFPGGALNVIHQYCDFDYCTSTYPRYNYAGRPAWSPDGTRLAFASTTYPALSLPALTSIYTIERSGGTPQLLIAGGQDPAWSPDGARIAFVRYQ